MSSSSIKCTQEQRRAIILLKMELKQILGYEPKDRELVDMFLKAFKEKQPIILSEILERVADKLKEIAINVEDYEKLKQENEELRKEIEELREKTKEVRVPEDPKEIFNLFVKSILKKVPQEKRRDVERGLRLFQLAIFDGGINVELLERLEEWVEETVYLLRTGRSSRDSETELRGGVTLW